MLALLFAASCTHALHFYLNAGENKCFIEEVRWS